MLVIKMNIQFETGRTRATVLANIAKIDALIASLANTALTSIANGNMIEYELDTGQTRTRVIYSKASEITSTWMEYEKIRQFYVNQLTPMDIRFVDSKNFPRNNC
jgi:hypothetical protein